MKDFDLLLPQTPRTYQYLQEKAAEEGVTVTDSRRLAQQPMGAFPAGERVAVMPKDTRESKYETPLLYIDAPAGEVPILVIGGGVYPWQELKAMADELRHYGKDAIERPERPPDVERDWKEHVERRAARRRGRRSFSFTSSKSWFEKATGG